MKLRSDREGKPFIVLEAGDIAAVKKVGVLLAGASVHLGEPTRMDMLRLAANLQAVVSGELPGLTVPKSRANKPSPQPEFAEPSEAAESPPGNPDQPPFAVPNLCERCGEPLVPSELRRSRRVCFSCAPLRESA